MRKLTWTLLVLLIVLQVNLWVGEGGVRGNQQLAQLTEQQREENRQLAERNRLLEAEVVDLKQGLEAIEERARTEMGMIREGETFYQVIEPAQD
ncbi:MAG TPA: cell division protein FtsB [Gammaproteobacteria bacterium]|nr:cell division protein FtsB [Gammaproteobacteria bacterium]